MCAVPGSPEVELVFAEYGKTDDDCPSVPSVPLTPLNPDEPDEPDEPDVPFVPPPKNQFAPLLVRVKDSYCNNVFVKTPSIV